MNLIYQYWDGTIRESARAGVDNMKAYAKRIGAEYKFEDNPQFLRSRGLDFGEYSPHYGAFKPVYDESFHSYDNVLFCDTDVFAVDGLKENIFEGFDKDIGICTEPFQPKQRLITLGRITSEKDELWAQVIKKKYNADVARTKEGLVKIYNTGVVLYSNQGLKKAQEQFVPFQEYYDLMRSQPLPNFYRCDQPYLHAMLFVCDFDWIEMDNNWNSYVHSTRDKFHPEKYTKDFRTKDTKFVHVQLSGADNWDADTHWRIVNLPESQWSLS